MGLILLILGFSYYITESVKSGLWFPNQNDFFHLYIAGFLAQRGENFFDINLIRDALQILQLPRANPFVYPPFFAILLIPLSWLPIAQAWLFFLVLSHAAFFAALNLLVKILCPHDDPPVFWWGILVAFSACFVPLFKTYSPGQVNTFFLLIITGSWFAFYQGNKYLTGFLLGLGAAIKVSPIFLLVYFAYKSQWRVVVMGLAAVLVSVMVSWAVLGGEVHQSFLKMVDEMSYGSSTWAEVGMHYHVEPHNQAPSALWYRLFTHNPSTIGIADFPLLAKILSYLTALAVVAILLWRTKRGNSPAITEYSLWSIGMLLIPSLMWDHYLTQMLFAIAVALVVAQREQAKGIVILAIGLTLMAIPYHYDIPLFKNGFMTLLMAIRLYGLLVLARFLIHNQHVDPIQEK